MSKRFSTFLSAAVLASITICGPAGSPPGAHAAQTRQPLSAVCRAPRLINQQWQPVPVSLQRPDCMKHP